MTSPNIALLATQRLSDAANGGGQMTGDIIPDNQADNLFADISREDRTAGRVSLRKAIMMALSADTKTYLGAHAIISAPPSDPAVSALMFGIPGNGAWTNVRTDARDFIESYLVQGPAMECWLYGTHVIGQRSILIFQKPDRPLQSIGDTIVLDDTTTDPENIQFVRITSIKDAVHIFTDDAGDYPLRVITLGINTPLIYRLHGANPQRQSNPPSPTLVCQTTVADAAKYYGVTKPTDDIDADALDATVESIFGQLVPATQAEVPITNASPQGVLTLVPAGTTKPVSIIDIPDTGETLYAGYALTPGTIEVRDSVGSLHAVDDGAGNLCFGTTPAGAHVGTIDYEVGSFFFLTNFLGAGYGFFYATPAAVASQSPYTEQQPVTEGTRGYVYVAVLNPIPQPKTLTVSYRSLSRWYDLTDDGTGTLVGPLGTGTGVVRFDSGAVSVTLGALPDIGSNVVFSWGQVGQYDIRTGDVAIHVPAISLVTSAPIKPGTVSISFVVGVTTHTVADDSAGGLTGYGTGTVEYGSGTILLRPTALPNPADGISVAYDTNPATLQTFTPSKSGSDISFTLSSAPVAPKSIHIAYSLTSSVYNAYLDNGGRVIARSIHDDGSGNLVDSVFGAIAGASINYTTGVISFNPDLAVSGQVPLYDNVTEQFWDTTLTPPAYSIRLVSKIVLWAAYSYTAAFVNASTVTVTSTAAGATNVSTTENFPTPSILVDLTPTTVEPIVPGSVVFRFAGDTYIDRAGSIYRAINHTNNAATLAGTIDYVTGQAQITNWPPGGASTLTIDGLLCEFGISPIGYLSARAPGQSIRPGSFFIQANRSSDGTLISATADVNGNWSNTHMVGHIEVSTGFFTVAFGQLVLDSSLTSDDKAEPWYDAANVDGTGHIWRPNEAIPGTVKFSCVVDTYLPLDPTILGIDPVRLPLDGRVQIFRPGDTLVFRNPLAYTLANPLVASTDYSMPRSGLEDIVLYDQDGVAVDTSNYTTDPTAGTIHTTSGMDMTGYVQPIVAVHTQADMVLCIDVQIGGQIAWNRPLTNAYPAASSYISGALVAGDLQAQYSNLFTQTTWNIHPDTLWEDVVQGTNTTAQFDDVTYPIEVIDRDCVTQRWAIIFSSSTAFSVVGEHYGVIATGNTSTNVAPINGATGNPFFVMNHLGFGSGWSTGNAIRFNTTGAGSPIWFARTVLAGAAANTDDKFATQLRWDE